MISKRLIKHQLHSTFLEDEMKMPSMFVMECPFTKKQYQVMSFSNNREITPIFSRCNCMMMPVAHAMGPTYAEIEIVDGKFSRIIRLPEDYTLVIKPKTSNVLMWKKIPPPPPPSPPKKLTKKQIADMETEALMGDFMYNDDYD